MSRGLDCAELFTDDARKLAVQLRKATGERIAALDGVALQGAHDTAIGVGSHAERDPGHAPSATERGRKTPSEHGRGSGPRQDTGRGRDGNLPEPGARRHWSGRESGGSGRAIDRSRGRSNGWSSGSATETSMEPAPMPVEPDFGM